MADEYDHLADPWYQYTFSRIDHVLECFIPPAPPSAVALDVGAGSGIQTARLAAKGYQVLGVDLAIELLALAKKKTENSALFCVGDAEQLPAPSSSVDVVNCCGPTLSFVPRWRLALQEIGRCLRPNGWLLLEVEGKWNIDLLWELLNGLGFSSLGYDLSLREALSHWKSPLSKGHEITYAFKLESGETVPMPLKLFTAKELRCELGRVGLSIERQWGLHSITNLLPSTLLHRADLSGFLRRLFWALAAIETRVHQLPPIRSLGCSTLVLARRR